MDLTGKKLLVIGGGNGIGAQTVLTYAERGASVASTGINTEAGQRIIKEAANRGSSDASFTYQRLDIRDEQAAHEAVDAAVQSMGGLDGITITAGMEAQISAVDVTTEHLHDVFGVNVFGPMYVVAAALSHLVDNGGGSIIAYSSGAGMDGHRNMLSYGSSKAALLGAVRSWATDWGHHHIRANAVCPAIITPMMEQFMANKTPEERQAMQEEFASKILLGGEPGTPKDAADLNAFLSSDESRMITGQTIPVDGGFNMVR